MLKYRWSRANLREDFCLYRVIKNWSLWWSLGEWVIDPNDHPTKVIGLILYKSRCAWWEFRRKTVITLIENWKLISIKNLSLNSLGRAGFSVLIIAWWCLSDVLGCFAVDCQHLSSKCQAHASPAPYSLQQASGNCLTELVMYSVNLVCFQK